MRLTLGEMIGGSRGFRLCNTRLFQNSLSRRLKKREHLFDDEIEFSREVLACEVLQESILLVVRAENSCSLQS